MRAMWRGVLPAAVCALALATSNGVRANATYTYDELGRIKTVTYTDGAQVTYTYDPADNRTQQDKSLASANQAPSAGNDSISVEVGAAITFDPLVNDSDPEAQALTIIGVTTAAEGDVSVVTNRTELTYQSTGSTAGSDSFTYYIQDTLGGIAVASVSVTLTIPNDPPVAANDSISTVDGMSVTFDPRTNDSDPDGDPLTIISVSTPVNGGSASINPEGTQITYSPNSLSAFNDSFTYTISDGQGGEDTATVSVTNEGLAMCGCCPC